MRVRSAKIAAAVLGVLLVPGAVQAAGAELPSLVRDIGFSLLAAGALVVVFTRLGIPEVAAFLVAGVAVGPAGAELITDIKNIDTIAQLGLVLLLFIIGLEIDVRKLRASGRVVLVTGLLQYPLCVLFGFAATKALVFLGIGGAALAGSSAALYVGLAVAASSTLIVVKLLQQNFQLDTQVGRICLALLIFQDIWAVVAISVQPSFGDLAIGPAFAPLVGIALLALIALGLGRYLIPVAFRWIAKLPEVILVAAVAWCFGIVFIGASLDRWLSGLAGGDLQMGVVPGMAALIAGLSIASLPYATEIVGKVGVVRDFFVTLFFVALGMSLPRPDGLEVIGLAALLAALAFGARYLVFLPLLYASGLDRQNAFVASTRLAQISEFGLVIAFLGVQLGQIPPELSSAIVLAFVLTALLTPALYRHVGWIYARLSPLLDRVGMPLRPRPPEPRARDYAIALLGFHRTASSLLFELEAVRPELLAQTLVIDFNVTIHDEVRARGPAVRYGDLQNTGTLQHTGVDRAKVIVCTIPDDVLRGTTNRQLVRAARQLNPGAVIIVNAIELEEADALYRAGADFVYLPRVESGRGVATAIERALAGEIAAHRADLEGSGGALWGDRGEVFR